jgi:hypothetical protein
VRLVGTALILTIYIGAATFIVLAVAVGLFRSRRHIMWKNPGYNIFTGKWSDEEKSDEDKT